MDELAVGEAVLADGRVDPRDPEAAELAFTVVAVARRVIEGVQDRLVGAAEQAMTLAFVAVGHRNDFLVTPAAGDSSFDATHLVIAL